MATKARQQYFADESSLSKERREFSIADEIQQKIDSVEEGAQVNKIETVKVNGTALVPDANKAVNVEVPDVIDNLYSTSTNDALSAKQGKLLYDYIQNIASRGRFLSNWNSATGLPVTNPTESPYPYKAGDYYSVSNVASGGGTNYRPDGNSYTIGQASTTVETEEVKVSDFYLYDGTTWILLLNTERQIAIDSSLSTTSTNPVENRVVTNAINGKQDVLTAGNHIDITNDVISAEGFQEELTAGENITIGDECTTESDMKGPCPSGFHVPSKNEWTALKNIWVGLGQSGSDGSIFGAKFKLPFGNYRFLGGDETSYNQGINGIYWSSTPKTSDTRYAYFTSMGGGIFLTDGEFYRVYGMSIRPFKNTPVIPDATWTVVLDGSSIASGAGIFHDAIEGLISASSNGTTWVTISDKNVGATVAWNEGDALNENNCGGLFQRGNNYMFPFAGTVPTTNQQVDTTGYGPGNYFSSNIFNIFYGDWSSPSNNNLRGGVTQGTFQDCIHNVISATDTTYTAGSGISIDQNNEISNTAQPTVVSGDSGVTYTIKVSNSDPASGTPATTITFVL